MSAEVIALDIESAVAVVGDRSTAKIDIDNIAVFAVEGVIGVVVKTGDSSFARGQSDSCAFAPANRVEFNLVITCAGVEHVAGAAKEGIIARAAGNRGAFGLLFRVIATPVADEY